MLLRLVSLFLALLAAPLSWAQSSAPFPIFPAEATLTPYQRAIAEHRAKAGAYYADAKFTESIAACKAGLALAEKNQNSGDQAGFLWQISYNYWLMGELPTALNYAQLGLRLSDKFPDDRRRSAMLRMIGVVYHSMGDLIRARDYSAEALTIAECGNFERERANALTTLGNIALKQGDLKTARRNFELAFDPLTKSGTARTPATALINLAAVDEAEKNFAKALAAQERVLAMRVESKDRRGQVNSRREISRVLRALGRLDEALAQLNAGLTVAEEVGGHEVLAKFYEECVFAHEALGKFDLALKYQRLATAARDALSGERVRAQAAELQARFEASRQQDAIRRLNIEKSLQAADLYARDLERSRDRAQRIVLYVALGFVLFGVIPVILSRQRQRA